MIEKKLQARKTMMRKGVNEIKKILQRFTNRKGKIFSKKPMNKWLNENIKLNMVYNDVKCKKMTYVKDKQKICILS